MKGFLITGLAVAILLILLPIAAHAAGVAIQPIHTSVLIVPLLLPVSLKLQLSGAKELRRRNWPAKQQQVKHFCIPRIGHMLLLGLFAIYLLATEYPDYLSFTSLDLLVLPIVTMLLVLIMWHGSAILAIRNRYRVLHPDAEDQDGKTASGRFP